MLPKPRFGYLLVARVKDAGFKKHPTLELPDLQTNAVWSLVLASYDNSSIKEGQLVYHRRGGDTVEVVIVDETRALGVIHESSIKLELPVPNAPPELYEMYGPDILANMKAKEEKEASAIIRANGSMVPMGN